MQLTRALADEYIRRGVRVNAVAPGGIDTPLQKAFYQMHVKSGLCGDYLPADGAGPLG